MSLAAELRRQAADIVSLAEDDVALSRDYTVSQQRELDVAFGVGVTAPFAAVGAVEPTPLPVGDVATTIHWGNYAQLGAAHNAVIAWCEAHGRRRAGPSWEIYGHWTEDETRLRTDVFYLLEPAASASH
jgi:hypothetical protein